MSEKPVCVDLFTGLHGWGEGFIAEGFEVWGFDLEDMGKMLGVPRPAGIQLVRQDVLTLHGSQFKGAAVIVASPPCQKYSYMAMPWKRAKALAAWYRESPERINELNALFDACFRIQREASEAAGRHIPLIVENVKGAQPWVGRAKANFGSFYLWGDIGMVGKRVVAGRLHSGAGIAPRSRRQKQNPDGTGHPTGSWFAIADSKNRGLRGTNPGEHIKNQGGSWFNIAHNTESGVGQNPVHEAGSKGGGDWFGRDKNCSLPRAHGSQSAKRKAASAMIAKIPFPLARHIARCFR